MTATKCYANLHMTMAEHSLWEVCRSLAYSNQGEIRFDGRHLASLYTGTSKSAIYRTASGLERNGWFELVRSRAKDQKTGRWLSAYYRVLTVEEWGKKFPHTHNSPVPESSSPVLGTGEPVPYLGHVQSQNSRGPVPKNENPVPYLGHSSDVFTERRDTDPSSTDPVPPVGQGKREQIGPSSLSNPTDLMPAIQKCSRYFLGKTVNVASGDRETLTGLVQRFGPEAVLLAWGYWLQDDEGEHLVMPDGHTHRKYPLKYFLQDTCAAEVLAEELFPFAQKGFKNPNIVQAIRGFCEDDEINELSPDDVVQLESLGSDRNFREVYLGNYKNGPYPELKEFAVALQTQPAQPAYN